MKLNSKVIEIGKKSDLRLIRGQGIYALRNKIGLIQEKEEGWTGFSNGWQGCSEGFPEGEAQGKSQ